MTNVAHSPDNSGKDSPLVIPDVSGMTVPEAAKMYAKSGMYLLPTAPNDIKNPGSIVGGRWQDQSSCDPEQIAEWYDDHPERGIACDVGRSGLIPFDFDRDRKPEDISDEVWSAVLTGLIHATREDPNSVRAHYIFACEPDEFGNSAGPLARFGFDVKCSNGVIILAPTPHPDAETKGGMYHWRKTGEVPPLPDVLRPMLTKAAESYIEPKTPDELKAFLAQHVGYDAPQGLQGLLTKFNTQVQQGYSRHITMRETLRWGFAEAIIGRFPAREVYDTPKFAFYRVKPEAQGTDDFNGLARWAAAHAELDDPEETRRKVERNAYADPLEAIKAEISDFWQSSQELRNLRQFAHSRIMRSWPMLGTTLARVIAHIPPNVVLPPTVGTHASLNFFVALVGGSGATKSTSISASADWLTVEPNYPPSKPGSGEGLAKCFAYKTKVRGTQKHQQVGKQWSVLALIPEVDTLNATGSRGGSTIMSALREGWSGERIGHDYAGEDKAIKLAPNRYRLCMVVGVQPERAAFLMHDADAGTPQRFIWLPTNDPELPDQPPDEPPPLNLGRWPEPKAGVVDPDTTRNAQLADSPDPTEYAVIGVPAAITDQIRATQLAIGRGVTNVDPLDGHRHLVRLKIAAGLMALENRHTQITESDWERAGVVMKVSDLTRKEVLRKMELQRECENRNRGRAEAQREIVRTHIINEEKELIEAMAKRIVERLEIEDGQTLSKIRKAVSAASTRERFDAAVRYAVEHLSVTREDFTAHNGQDSARLWLICPPSQQTR